MPGATSKSACCRFRRTSRHRVMFTVLFSLWLGLLYCSLSLVGKAQSNSQGQLNGQFDELRSSWEISESTGTGRITSGNQAGSTRESISHSSKTSRWPRIMLVSAYASSSDGQDSKVQEALLAWNECAARNMGLETYWQNEQLKKHAQFPHYIKIESIKQAMEMNPGMDWMVWLDADVRWMPWWAATSRDADLTHNHQWSQLVERLNKNDVHLVVLSQYSYSTYINNLFLVKNTDWGRYFVRLWDSVVLGGESCGYYDQCPFGIAVVQFIRYYLRPNIYAMGNVSGHETNNRKSLLDPDLEQLAWHVGNSTSTGYVQDVLLKRELDKVVRQHTSSKERARVGLAPDALHVGPVVFLPSWGATAPSIAYPRLAMEPATLLDDLWRNFSKFQNDTSRARTNAWPLFVHAKYSQLFCKRRLVRQLRPTSRKLFYKLVHQWLANACSAKEAEILLAENRKHPCWIRPSL